MTTVKNRNYTLNSKQKKSFENINNITYATPYSNLTLNEFKIHEFSIRNTLYNVNQYNCGLKLSYLGTTYQINIKQGYYDDITSLLANLKSQLDACGSTLVFTCTSDSINYKTTISSTAVFQILFDSESNRKLLGYTSTSQYTLASTYTSENAYNLVYSDYIMVMINELGLKIELPITVFNGYIMTFSNKHLNMLNGRCPNINSLTVELRDEYGKLIETISDYILRYSFN